MALVRLVYELTEEFPRKEMFGLAQQLRRAAVSLPSNIAEGQGRMTSGEWSQFLGQARGSLFELETQLLIARDRKYTTDTLLRQALDECAAVGRMLNRLIEYVDGSRARRKPRPTSGG